MIEEWKTQPVLDSHLRSDLVEVLLGTKNFLSKPYEIYFNTERRVIEFDECGYGLINDYSAAYRERK